MSSNALTPSISRSWVPCAAPRWCGVLLIALLLPSMAYAWSATGHMIISQIAYDELSAPARAEADRLIAALATADPATDHFVPAAVWMDGERDLGFRAHDRWHYINLPINGDGLATVPAAADDNVVAAIQTLRRTLADPEAGTFQRALALRYLLHMVGDVHQPLHCVARYTLELPNGDRGGNDFQLVGEAGETAGASNLHAYWDRTLGLFPHVAPDGPWREQIPRFAATVLAAVPPPSADRRTDVLATDPEAWAREGFHHAKAYVYADIESGGAPSAEYRQRGEPVVHELLALAGRRLAVLLNEALLTGAPPPYSSISGIGEGAATTP